MQGRNRDADVDSRCEDTGVREGGMNWEIGIDIYALPWVKEIDSGDFLCSSGSYAQR